MKKIVFVILAILILVSCSLVIKDPDGWEIYQFGWTLDDGQVLIQSHDGYRIGDNLYTEHIVTPPVSIENVLNRTINVKITRSSSPGIWEKIGPYEILEVH